MPAPSQPTKTTVAKTRRSEQLSLNDFIKKFVPTELVFYCEGIIDEAIDGFMHMGSNPLDPADVVKTQADLEKFIKNLFCEALDDLGLSRDAQYVMADALVYAATRETRSPAWMFLEAAQCLREEFRPTWWPVQTGGAFIREQLRAVSFKRQIIPPIYISQ